MTQNIPTSTYVKSLKRDAARVTVLTVGIDESTREGIRSALESRVEDARVVTAATPSDARRQLGSEEIDCIVSGDDLPETTGLDFFREIRGTDDARPFVLYATAGSEALAAKAVNAGVDGYFPDEKGSPDHYAEVAARIERVVDEDRAYAELEETARLLLKLTEYTNDALWMFTADWSETIIINSAYDTVWDRSIDDLIADPGDFLEGVYPEDREIVTDAMEVLSGGEAADLEYRVTTDDGIRWVNVHAEPVFDARGDIEYVAGFTRDVTELKDRELSMESLNEASTELLQVRDKRAVADTVIDIAEAVIGCPMTVVRVADDDGRELVPMAATEAALDTVGIEDVSELSIIDPEDSIYEGFDQGETRHIEDDDLLAEILPQESDIGSLVTVPLGEHGLLTVGTAPSQDLSEFDCSLIELLGQTTTAALDRVERDEELDAYREQLEMSNENLQQFAYTASHDLQEPLRMVSSYVDLLESEYGDQLDGEASEYMEFAVDGARRMQDMIDALLQYARVQTRAQEREETDPDRIVEETLDSLQLRIEETDTTVSTESLPNVEADPNQLGQVFQNLLKNAITYADESGVDPEIAVSATRDDGMVTFSVSDNGPGVDEESLEDVFEIFKRGGTHDDDGTGIGLAVCRRIVHRHDGEIWIEPDTEGGATFTFTMPAPQTEVTGDD